MKIKANQDIYYSTTADTFDYHIENKGNMIFKGRAYKNPDAANCDINITKICRDWVKNTLPDFRNYTNSAITQEEAYQEFKLYTYSSTTVEGEEVLVPVLLETYDILFDYDYELPWSGGTMVLSNPINGRMDSRMKLFYTTYKANTGESICYRIAVEPQISIHPSYAEVGNSGGIASISISANTEYDIISNSDWITVSPSSGDSGYTTATAVIASNNVVSARMGNIFVGDKIFEVRQEAGSIPNNEIWYTSTYGNAVAPYSSGTGVFGANIISNTYSEGQGKIVFDGNVTNIGYLAFYTKNALQTIKIPNSVTSIGKQAFSSCSGLTNVIIGNSVTSIGYSAFQGCNSLTGITIPNSVTIIRKGAFFGCRSLTGITIPNSVTIIESSTFELCSGLTNVIIGNSVTSIENWAFEDCRSLTGITIPNSVTAIKEEVFAYCTSLNTMNYLGTMAQWNAISKGYNWKYFAPATVVHCTDGDVPI